LLPLLALSGAAVVAQPFTNFYPQPALDRWMYPFNATPGFRPSAPVFGTFGDAAGVDTRHGQFLIGFDTTNEIPAGIGATNYLLRRVTLTAVISRDNVFTYDPTQDSFLTYPSNALPQLADDDAGRPLELFGAGFRNGFTVTDFLEDSAFGSGATGGRNAYAAGWSTNLALVDVGNNCGKTNGAFPNFEVWPFAVGTLTNIAPGQLVPMGSKFSFHLNLADPLVRHYVQQALHDGRLRFTLTGFQGGTFGGQPSYPDFFTRDNFVAADPPQLLIEGAVIRPDDTDVDGLPDDWERFYFANLAVGATPDTDGDGHTNFAEYLAGTDPADSRDSLSPVSIAINAAGHREVRFRFTGGRSYGMDYSTHLVSGSGWQAIASPAFTTPEPGVLLWVDDGSQTGGTSGERFYRLRTP
jgi:hypothetical protein